MLQQQRFEQLDSLRGLAALSVMLGHFLQVFPKFTAYTYPKGYDNIVNLLKYTPLHLFWAGGEAVIFFFILSGFVLALPFLNNRGVEYPKYLVRRVCRIYIPYIAAVAVAIAARLALAHDELERGSMWIKSIWTGSFSWRNIAEHVAMLWNFNSTIYDPILWSLVHEMRISIVFPLIMLVVVRLHWATNLLLAIGCTLSAQLLDKVFNPPYMTNFPMTLHFIAFFIGGALLAKHRVSIVDWMRKQARSFHVFLFVFAVLVYTLSWTAYGLKLFHNDMLQDWIAAAGASLFVVAALSTASFMRALQSKPLVFLGKISYSLYLFHMIVLLALLHLLEGYAPVGVILLIAFAASFAVSVLAYEWIEKPSMQLGRRLTRGRTLANPNGPGGVSA